MLYDKDIVGMLVNLVLEVDVWYCVLLEGLCGVMVEQLVEYLCCGIVYSSVVQVWCVVMVDVKVEDIVLVCGLFYIVVQVMEEIDVGRIGGE